MTLLASNPQLSLGWRLYIRLPSQCQVCKKKVAVAFTMMLLANCFVLWSTTGTTPSKCSHTLCKHDEAIRPCRHKSRIRNYHPDCLVTHYSWPCMVYENEQYDLNQPCKGLFKNAMLLKVSENFFFPLEVLIGVKGIQVHIHIAWLRRVWSPDSWQWYHCTIIKFWTGCKTAEDCWWTAHPFSCCRAVRHEGDHLTVHCLCCSTGKYCLVPCPLYLIKMIFSCVSHSPTSGLGISRMSTSTMRNFTTTLSRISRTFGARKKGRKSAISCCGGTGKRVAFICQNCC